MSPDKTFMSSITQIKDLCNILREKKGAWHLFLEFANFLDFRNLVPYRRGLFEFQLFGVIQHLPFEGGDEFLALGRHKDVVGSFEDLDGCGGGQFLFRRVAFKDVGYCLFLRSWG